MNSRTFPTSIGKTAQSLPALLAEHLLGEILSGRLAPGDRLPETQLATQHMVSRATVREALQSLERHHFVERLPRYGASVAAIRKEDIEELFELRAAIFGLAAARAARLSEDAELRALDELVTELDRLAHSEVAATDYTDAVLRTQGVMIESARSRWIASVYDQISSQMLWRVLVRDRGAVFASAQRRLDSAQDWRRMLDAVLRRDEAAAESAARELTRASGAFLLHSLPHSPQDPARHPGG